MIAPNPVDTARAYVMQCATFADTTRKLGKLEVSFKEGDVNNVLTHVDLANSARARQMFAPFLQAGEILIDEENLPPGTPAEIFASGKPLWIIDPIDGTRPFSKGEASWGVMLSRIVGGRVVYANINMPAMGQRLQLYPEGGSVTCPDDRKAFVRTLQTGTGSTVHLSNRVENMLQLCTAHGFHNVYAPSAAEVTISMATGQCALAAFPSKAGIWDIAPAMMLAAMNGYVAFFESDPHTFLTITPDMFLPNWQLRDHLIITSKQTHAVLYPTS